MLLLEVKVHTWQLAVRMHPVGAQGGCGIGQRDCRHRWVADAGQLLRRLGTAALQAVPLSCGVSMHVTASCAVYVSIITS